MLYIIILLILFSVGIIIFLFLLKKEIHSVQKQLHEYSMGCEKPIDVAFIDKDLTELAAEINKTQTLHKNMRLSVLKRENHLKESVSNISHDLRTPLTSMIGYLQLFQKTELTDEQREYLEISLARGWYLQRLIKDFYDISILENEDATPVLTKINLDNVLAEIILSFTEQFERRDISPKISFSNEAAYVTADEIMLRRVLTNLVSNAIRYGTKELQISILQNDFVSLKFQNMVEDKNDIDVEKLFEKFYTSDISRNKSGTGLGLYIVKILTEKMNGNVSADLDGDKLTICLSLIKANSSNS